MKNTFVLDYRDQVHSFVKFIKITATIGIIALILIEIFVDLAIGLKVFYGICILLLVGALSFAFTHTKAPLELSFAKLTYQKRSYSYKEITAIKEVNNSLLFIFHDKTLFKLNEFYFDEKDLIEMNNRLSNVSLAITDTTEHFALEKIDQPSVSNKHFIVVSIIGFIYIIALANGIYHYPLLCGILSLLMPLLLALYYMYLMLTNQKEMIISHRVGFLMGMLFPALLGLGVIFFVYSTTSMNPIITASAVLFIIILSAYLFLERLRKAGHDLLFIIFLMIYLPLVMMWGNVNITLSSQTLNKTVDSVNIQSTKMGNVYNAKYITSVNHLSTTISAQAGKGKKKGDLVSVNYKYGLFNTVTGEHDVTIKTIKKTSAGYSITYNEYHYNRIMLSEAQAIKLKKGDHILVLEKHGLFGVNDYKYLKKVA